jgi:hypothetical protein
MEWSLGTSGFMPTVTWEAEVWRITVPGHLSREVCETPSQWKKDGHAGTCLSSQQCWEAQNRKVTVQVGLGKNWDSMSK